MFKFKKSIKKSAFKHLCTYTYKFFFNAVTSKIVSCFFGFLSDRKRLFLYLTAGQSDNANSLRGLTRC